MVKNTAANAGDIRDAGMTPGSEDPLEEGVATHSSILAWRMPQTEEPGRLQSMRSRTRLTNTHNIYSLSIYNMYVNKHIYPYF